MDIDEDDDDDKEEVINDQKESKKPTTKPIVHSKSLDDLSPEEASAKKYKSSQGSGANGQTLTSLESFNNFLYWRDPLPVLDDLDDLKKGVAEEPSSEVNRTAESEDEAVTSPETDNSGEKKGALDEIWTGCPVITFQAFADLTDATDTSTMELFRPESGISSNGKLVFDPNTLSIKNNNHQAQQQQQQQQSQQQQQQMQDPALPRGPPATLQSIVPQLLVDHFVSMTDPSRAQTVDSEIAHHCAFSL